MSNRLASVASGAPGLVDVAVEVDESLHHDDGRHAFTAPNDFMASGKCSREYQVPKASRLAASDTVGRTTKKAAGMFLSLELVL